MATKDYTCDPLGSSTDLVDPSTDLVDPSTDLVDPSTGIIVQAAPNSTMPQDQMAQASSAPAAGKPPSSPPLKMQSDTAATPSPSCSNLYRFPVRIGINWKKGEKLEAMDFSQTWYPSKIVDVDEDQKHVLIHFEGWNSRYDEWVAMDSEKLRPQTRHSERKDKGVKRRRIYPHPVSSASGIYRPGEQVLAKWTDCKKYPAKISRALADGYEVVFYDGVSRTIQPINIQPMPESMEARKLEGPKTLEAPPREKSSFKSIKLQLPDSVLKRTKPGVGQSRRSMAEKILAKEKRRSPHKNHSTSPRKRFALQAKRKPAFGPKTFAEKKIKTEASLEEPQASPALTLTLTPEARSPDPPSFAVMTTTAQGDPSRPASNLVTPLHKEQAAQGGPELTDEKAPASPAASALPVATAASAPVAVVAMGTSPAAGPRVGKVRRMRKRGYTDPSLSKRKQNRLKASVDGITPSQTGCRPPGGVSQRAKSVDSWSEPSGPTPMALPPPQLFVPSKAFVVEEDHNPFKCPFGGCNKDFRKESLLAYHIKYYHSQTKDAHNTSPCANSPANASASDLSGSATPALASPTGGVALATPLQAGMGGSCSGVRKRRKKTSSVCSADSDVSLPAKGGKSVGKRQRHNSDFSSLGGSPDQGTKALWTASQESLLEDPKDPETEEEETESDMINCKCSRREANGLMIQCEVCMCWQHFACEDMEGAGIPPANHVCSICIKPKGIRNSCKFLHDFGWERRGELPTYPFTSDTQQKAAKETKLRSVACKCHQLSAALLGIKSALHSTRRQIKISKEEEDAEFQLWQTDWDNWTKPEEDLTLTPRSVEPAPSPTPSTFLFPPAPTPPAWSLAACSPLEQWPALPASEDKDFHPATDSESLPLPRSPTSPLSSEPCSKELGDKEKLHAPATHTSGHISAAVTSEDALPDTQPGNPVPSSSLTPPIWRSMAGQTEPHSTPNTPSVHRAKGRQSISGQAPGLSKDLFPDLQEGHQHPDCLGERARPSGSLPSPSGIHHKPGWKQADQPPQTKAASSPSRQDTLAGKSATDVLESQSGIDPLPGSRPTALPTSCPFPKLAVSLPSSALATPSDLLPSSHQPSNNPCVCVSGVAGTTSSCLGLAPTSADPSSSVETGQATSADPSSSLETSPAPGDKPDSQFHPSRLLPSASDAAAGQIQALGDMKPESLWESLNAKTTGREATKSSPLEDAKMAELFISVPDERATNEDDDNDTDTAEESADPYRHCERNLLLHITHVHSQVESQLQQLEQQVKELEQWDCSDPDIQLSEENILNDVPALKKSLCRYSRHLGKIRRLCVFH